MVSKEVSSELAGLGYEPSLGPSPYPPERQRSEALVSEYSRDYCRGAQTVSRILNKCVVTIVVIINHLAYFRS